MPRLSNEKLEKLEKIQNARELLNHELKIGFIKEEDILNLLNKNINEFLNKDKYKKYQLAILRDICNCPFLLCDQECLSIELKKLIPLILKSRYDMEIGQLNYLYNNGQISKEEVEKEKDMTMFCFYKSSLDGKSILKTGHVLNVCDNIIRSK